MKNIDVFLIIQKKRIRCEVFSCRDNESIKKSYALTRYPIINNESDLPIVIPLIFDPAKSKQKALYIDSEEDQEFFRHVINQDNCTLIFKPIDNVSFEILLSDAKPDDLQDELAQMLSRHRGLPQIPDVDEAIKRIDKKIAELNVDEFVSNIEGKDVTELIRDLLKCEIENIPIELFDRVPSDSLSQEDLELWSSFKDLVRILGHTNVIKQDIINALSALVQVQNCSNKLYSEIIKHHTFIKILSREDRDEIHYSVVLSHIAFFDSKTIKSTANYFYNKKDYTNSVTLFQEYLERIKADKELESDFSETFNSIGCCYVELLQFDKAYQAYSNACEKDKMHSAALNNWAYTLLIESETTPNKLRKQKLLREALAYINDAIQISSDEVSYISNRAYIEYSSGDYDRVLKDLSRARELSKKYDDYSSVLKLSICARIKIAIDEHNEEKLLFSDLLNDLMLIYKNEPNKSKYYFEALKVYIESSKTEDKDTLNELSRILLLLEFHVSELLDSIAIHDPKQDIYYYTSMRSLQMVLLDVNDSVRYRLPLFNVNHMNDPREGKEFESVLSLNNQSNLIFKDLFNENEGMIHSRKRLTTDFVFLKSFTKNDDSLPMWVHYADTGKGCCVKVSRSFFTNFSSDLNGDDKTFTPNPFDNEYRLYSVLYVKDGKLINPVSNVVEENYNKFLLYYSQISALYTNLNKKTQILVSNAIRIITRKLRYLDFYRLQKMVMHW